MDQADREYLKIWLLHAVMGLAATTAIILRFLARRRTKAVLKWDDWISFSALLFMWGDFACTILENVPHVKRIPTHELSITDQNYALRTAYASILLTDACEVAARMSVIFLYYRLFSIKRWLGWSLKTVGALSILWLLCLIFTVSFQCKPIAALLDATVEGECLDNQTGFLSSEIFNACLDLMLVCLPVRIIWHLRLPLRERLGIATIFLTGGLVILTGVIRMVYGYHPGKDDTITSMAGLSLWTGLHLGFAVICTSLPVFRVYLPKEDGFVNSKLRLLYRSASGWVGRTTRTASKATAPSLPSFVDPNRKAPHTETRQVDEIPLTTNMSSISKVERLGVSEYHCH